MKGKIRYLTVEQLGDGRLLCIGAMSIYSPGFRYRFMFYFWDYCRGGQFKFLRRLFYNNYYMGHICLSQRLKYLILGHTDRLSHLRRFKKMQKVR